MDHTQTLALAVPAVGLLTAVLMLFLSGYLE